MLKHIANFAMADFCLVKEGVYFMSENFENGNWVHVDTYTKDDGTQVREHWRRKYAGQIQYDNNNILRADLHYDVINNGADKKEYQKYLEQKFVDVGKYTLGELDKLPEPIKNAGEDILVSGVNKNTKRFVDLAAPFFSKMMNSPNALELYKVASPNNGYNMEYVKKMVLYTIQALNWVMRSWNKK